jgi:uncharacterized membrane protein
MAAQCIDGREFGVASAQGEALIWLFKRNCSISPRQTLMFFVSMAFVALIVAMLCWIGGAHMVTPFTLLELLVFGAALFVYARHAGDRERVLLSARQLVVEWECAGEVERTAFNPRWAKVAVNDRGLVEIVGEGRRAWVGRYTRPERREKLARDLRRALLAA